ncbi:MAG: hypothetical protein AAFQ37_11185 [Bacteroidota bacterium]
MRILDLVIIERGHNDGVDPLSYTSVQAWKSAESRLATEWQGSGIDLNAAVVGEDYYANQAWFDQLNIVRYPVLLISDRETGGLIARLDQGQINAENIERVLRQIRDLPQDPETGAYTTPDGRPLGGTGIFPGTFGFGLFNFPWWVWAIGAYAILSKKE